MSNNFGSLSIDKTFESASIPSTIHAKDSPVPVPNSRIFALGFEVANVLNIEPVYISQVKVNPNTSLTFFISLNCGGKLVEIVSFIDFVFGNLRYRERLIGELARITNVTGKSEPFFRVCFRLF